MRPSPLQISTANGSIAGVIDGINPLFFLEPDPTAFQFSLAEASGIAVFRNGLLLDSFLNDFFQEENCITVPTYQPGDVLTARVWPLGGPTTLRIQDTSIIPLYGDAFRLYSQDTPAIGEAVPFMLFRNGQLLTSNADYSVTDIWIQLIQPFFSGDTLVALTSTGGAAVSTFDGSISGTIDGVNPLFYLAQDASGQTWGSDSQTWESDTDTWGGDAGLVTSALVFRNGQLLTEGLDYIRFGAQIQLLGAQIPRVGDTLTAQIWGDANVVQSTWGGTTATWGGDTNTWGGFSSSAITSLGPAQVSTFDGTLFNALAEEVLVFRNGLLMTSGLDYSSTPDSITFSGRQVPTSRGSADTLTAMDYIDGSFPGFDGQRSVGLPDNFPLSLNNLPAQFTTNDGSITGAMNRANPVYTLATSGPVTSVMFWWNGDFQTPGVDYLLETAPPVSSANNQMVIQVVFISAPYPSSGDVLTARVWSV